MNTIAVLGATGSIGTQTLDIVRRYPDSFRVTVLTAHTSSDRLFALVREFHPRCAVLDQEIPLPDDVRDTEWFFGSDGITRALLAARPDMTLCAIVGIAGLDAVMCALDVSQKILLANKEALVTGGYLVTEKAKRLNKPLLPVDSEHSAIFQALRGTDGNAVSLLHLTASGGALRDMPLDRVPDASVADVLKHPTWDMGRKITVDCATMVNKGLEIMEACHLFGVGTEKVHVVLHPESVIHSMIEYEDGTISAILAAPDMRGPISYAMSFPERVPFGGDRLDFSRLMTLHFSEPDLVRYPALELARAAQREGGSAPVVLNGANEYAVASFLAGRIRFGDITRLIAGTLSRFPHEDVHSIADVHDIDLRARAIAKEIKI